MFSVFHPFILVDIKFISLMVLVLMFTSIDGQSNDSICDYLLEEGRVTDLGLYQFVRSFENEHDNEKSYQLFRRDNDEEHQLEIRNWTVSAKPSPIRGTKGLHKFYAGYDWLGYLDQSVYTDLNCRVEQRVCLL